MRKIRRAISIGKNEGVFEMFSRSTQYIISNLSPASYIKKIKYKRAAVRTEKNTLTTKYSEADFLIDSWNEYRVTNDGTSEQILIDDLIEQADDSDVFYDIGAAIGTHSCLIAPHVGKTIAFEPYPPNAEKIAENAETNNVDVDVFECALANHSGTATMRIHREAVGDAGHSIINAQNEYNNTFEATIERGDDLVENDLLTPNILKIDAEGTEAEVLRGFESTLSSPGCKLVYVEVHRPPLLEKIQAILRKENFETELIDTRGNTQFLRGKKN